MCLLYAFMPHSKGREERTSFQNLSKLYAKISEAGSFASVDG